MKKVILGKEVHLEPLSQLIPLKDVEAARSTVNKALKAHGKGPLYLASIHGKAEMIREIMRMYDRLRMQEIYRRAGTIKTVPSTNFYLARAYGILRDYQGQWEQQKLDENLSFVMWEQRPRRGRKSDKFSRWNNWWAVTVKGMGMGNPSDASTPSHITERNFRRFCELYTYIPGSAYATKWGLSGKDVGKARAEARLNSKPQTMAETSTTDESPVREVPIVEEVRSIWLPNQKDHELRQLTFSHPSQEALAQATKQLRSEWTPNSFDQLNLVKGLPQAITSITLAHVDKENKKPTAIQSLGIPIITKLDTEPPNAKRESLRSFLIAGETGSGKTLTYLIPLINRLKREEEWSTQHPDSPLSIFNTHRPAEPRAFIIVPTSELAFQVYKILKELSHVIKFTVCALLPKFDDATIRKSILPKYIDILVSTPHRLNEFMHAGEIRKYSAKYLVVDEADTIMDRSFAEPFSTILNRVQPELRYLVVCTATIPVALEEQLGNRFSRMQRIIAPKIHTAPRRLEFSLALEGDKREGLLRILRDIQQDNSQPDSDVKRAIVFCNAREGVREVYEFLKASEDVARQEGREGVFQLIPFTRDNFDRHTALERFNDTTEETEKKLRILITTDMGSRGLDTLQAKTVVLYDVPFSSLDLLHRLGRTARAGTRGRAIMIVSKAEYRGKTKEWVNEIRDRLIRGEALV